MAFRSSVAVARVIYMHKHTHRRKHTQTHTRVCVTHVKIHTERSGKILIARMKKTHGRMVYIFHVHLIAALQFLACDFKLSSFQNDFVLIRGHKFLNSCRTNLLKSLWHYNTRTVFGIAQRDAKKNVVFMTHIIHAINQLIIHSVLCLTTGPYCFQKRVLHRVRCSFCF